MLKLAIIVPYRNRAAHLDAFIPHVRAYFARDKVDRSVPYKVFVIEQDDDLPFNRGALLNVGFALAEPDCDYVCFHDVDYLPIWADYSAVDRPTPMLWYGAEVRPIAPGRSDQGVRNNLDQYYSGALLVPTAQFRQVDGFANSYWGWGFEDVDLKQRFDRAGIALGRRKGTFQPLDHDNQGFKLDGTPAPISTVNQRIFDQRWSSSEPASNDGLSTLDYQIMRRHPIPDPRPERAADWLKVSVRLKSRPSSEQVAAIAAQKRAGAATVETRKRRGR